MICVGVCLSVLYVAGLHVQGTGIKKRKMRSGIYFVSA